MKQSSNGVLTDREVTNRELAREVVTATMAAIPYLGRVPRCDAARWCYWYLRDHVTYIAEHRTQRVRMPWRTLREGQGDCKSTAVFIAAVCARAGCDVRLRFVSYRTEPWLAHVYAIVDGNVVDPLLPFGHEVEYASAVTVPVH